jgi:hypothetical protein
VIGTVGEEEMVISRDAQADTESEHRTSHERYGESGFFHAKSRTRSESPGIARSAEQEKRVSILRGGKSKFESGSSTWRADSLGLLPVDCDSSEFPVAKSKVVINCSISSLIGQIFNSRNAFDQQSSSGN